MSGWCAAFIAATSRLFGKSSSEEHRRSELPIGIRTIPNAADLNGIFLRVDEKQAVVTGAKAHLIAISQALYVADAGLRESMEGIENPHRRWLMQHSDVSSGR